MSSTEQFLAAWCAVKVESLTATSRNIDASPASVSRRPSEVWGFRALSEPHKVAGEWIGILPVCTVNLGHPKLLGGTLLTCSHNASKGVELCIDTAEDHHALTKGLWSNVTYVLVGWGANNEFMMCMCFFSRVSDWCAYNGFFILVFLSPLLACVGRLSRGYSQVLLWSATPTRTVMCILPLRLKHLPGV